MRALVDPIRFAAFGTPGKGRSQGESSCSGENYTFHAGRTHFDENSIQRLNYLA